MFIQLVQNVADLLTSPEVSNTYPMEENLADITGPRNDL